MRLLLAACAVSALLAPLSAEAAGMRCGSELVSDGASHFEVIQKCGKPAWTETRTVYDTVGFYDLSGVFVQRQVVRTIDEWIYSTGSADLDQHVFFTDGRLVEVRAGKYGR